MSSQHPLLRPRRPDIFVPVQVLQGLSSVQSLRMKQAHVLILRSLDVCELPTWKLSTPLAQCACLGSDIDSSLLTAENWQILLQHRAWPGAASGQQPQEMHTVASILYL